MNTAYLETRSAEVAAYGGLIDAIGGIATAVLAVIALTGFAPESMAGAATIVFGAALLIEGGTLLSEYTHLWSPAGMTARTGESFAGEGISAMFLVGVGGIVLGVLALLRIAPQTLTSVAVIAFGSALLLSSSAVRQLYVLQTAQRRVGAEPGAEFLAGEMASGSAGFQVLAGLAAVVLGVLAVCGIGTTVTTLAALLVLGVTLILTGSTLSGLVMSFMRPHQESRA